MYPKKHQSRYQKFCKDKDYFYEKAVLNCFCFFPKSTSDLFIHDPPTYWTNFNAKFSCPSSTQLAVSGHGDGEYLEIAGRGHSCWLTTFKLLFPASAVSSVTIFQLKLSFTVECLKERNWLHGSYVSDTNKNISYQLLQCKSQFIIMTTIKYETMCYFFLSLSLSLQINIYIWCIHQFPWTRLESILFFRTMSGANIEILILIHNDICMH